MLRGTGPYSPLFRLSHFSSDHHYWPPGVTNLDCSRPTVQGNVVFAILADIGVAVLISIGLLALLLRLAANRKTDAYFANLDDADNVDVHDDHRVRPEEDHQVYRPNVCGARLIHSCLAFYEV